MNETMNNETNTHTVTNQLTLKLKTLD